MFIMVKRKQGSIKPLKVLFEDTSTDGWNVKADRDKIVISKTMSLEEFVSKYNFEINL